MTARSPNPDSSTREYLLDVAERLFVSRGVDEVSLRAIVREAGQKNQSALQYHFGNRDGLITALSARRQQQLEARRAKLVRETLSGNANPTLREVFAIQIRAPFLLCREDASFRDILGRFGLQLLTSDGDFLATEVNQDAPSLFRLWEIILQQVDHLPLELLTLRAENAHGAALLALSRRAKYKGSFRGRNAELFFNNLVDQVVAMLLAPISDQTQGQL